jgi:hypothetical protein
MVKKTRWWEKSSWWWCFGRQNIERCIVILLLYFELCSDGVRASWYHNGMNTYVKTECGALTTNIDLQIYSQCSFTTGDAKKEHTTQSINDNEMQESFHYEHF